MIGSLCTDANAIRPNNHFPISTEMNTIMNPRRDPSNETPNEAICTPAAIVACSPASSKFGDEKIPPCIIVHHQ